MNNHWHNINNELNIAYVTVFKHGKYWNAFHHSQPIPLIGNPDIKRWQPTLIGIISRIYNNELFIESKVQ